MLLNSYFVDFTIFAEEFFTGREGKVKLKVTWVPEASVAKLLRARAG